MATATSSALPLNTATGRSVVTLTSYSGPITWATTPVSGDQIEYPDQITVGVDGTITGPAGTYTVRHIIATTGAVQAVSYVRAAVNSASASISLDVDIVDEFDYVTLSSYSGPMTFTTTPVAGDQIAYPNQVTVGSDGSFSGANSTYTIWHIVASTGIVEAISYTHSGANTAPTFGSISDVVANQTDTANFSIAATDPDTGDVLTYSHDVLPNGITRTGSTVSGTYNNEETVLTTFTVQDDSGDTGNDSDTAQVLFSIARAGYTITTLTVNYANLNPDSPLIAAITDSDLTVGDQVDYPTTVTDAVSATRTIGFASDGLMSVTGTRSVKVDNVYIRDSSASYARTGPFSVTLKGTGPTLTSPLEVVPNSPTSSGGQMRFTTDEGSEVVGANGDYRLIAIPSGFGTPTRAQVMAGNGPDGNPALFDSGLQQQAATVEEIVTVTGLPTQGAGYWIFLCLEDQYGGRTLEGPVTLTTVASGTPPVWSTVPAQSFTEGTAFSLDLSAFCSDFVSFSISGLASGTGLSFNTTTGVLSGTPTTVDASGGVGTTTDYTVIVTAFNATGNAGTTFTASFYALDLPVNSSTIPTLDWRENVAVSIGLGTYITNATGFELEVDSGGFVDATAVFATYGLTFNATTGAITGTPNATMVAAAPLPMRARGTNPDGNGDWQTFTINVDAASGVLPFMGADSAVSVNSGSVSVGTFAAVAGELPITYALSGADSALFSIDASAVVTFLSAPDYSSPADADANNIYQITITGTNTHGSDSINVSVQVASLVDPTFWQRSVSVSRVVDTTEFIEKDQDDTSNYWLNYSDVVDGRVVTGVQVDPDATLTDIVISGQGVNDEIVTDDGGTQYAANTLYGVKLTGGVAGERYNAVMRFTFESGEIEDHTQAIDVKQR